MKGDWTSPGDMYIAFWLPNDDVLKATDSRESWKMKRKSMCDYPVIGIYGHTAALQQKLHNLALKRSKN